MKVLVTGATGFIGSHVVNQLLAAGHRVIATSTNPDKAQEKDWFNKVTYIPFNFDELNAGQNYYELFQQPDAIIHTAWEGLPNYKADFHLDVNLPRHQFFLDNLISNGLTQVLVTGTCFEYGKQEGCLTEDIPTLPNNAYAQAKDKLRKWLEQHPGNFTLKWARLFYMYGSGQSPKSLLSQLDKALNDGDRVFNMSGGLQLRDYLPVETVALYLVKLMEQTTVNGIINCCSSRPVTVKALVEDYLKQKKQHIELNLGYYPYTDYEPMEFWGSTEKLDKALAG